MNYSKCWVVTKTSTADAITTAIISGKCSTPAQVEKIAKDNGDKVSWAILGLLEAPVKQGIDDVARVLMDLGITPNLKGYDYLRAAVTIVANEGMPKRGIYRELYPRVAMQEGTTPSRVERSIRHAIERAFDRSDPDTLESMFGSSADPGRGKLTNSEFISSVALYLRAVS